mgnify:CR=1 FL=1
MPSYYITDVDDDEYLVRSVGPRGHVASGRWWTIHEIADQMAHGAVFETAVENYDGSFTSGAPVHLELRTASNDTISDNLTSLDDD